MTKDQTINAGLLTAFGIIVAGLVPAFAMNFWYGIVDIAAMLIIAVTYELLP